MTKPTLRVALFGSGRISRIHGRNIANHPDLELAVVCSRNPDSASRLAALHGATAMTDAAEVFADSDLDAVVMDGEHSVYCPGLASATPPVSGH